MTSDYLYESLIQTEFDMENQMQASVEQSSSIAFQQALLAMKSETARREIKKELAE
jgi:alpha-D-ribose 1-methylphosphonate 5-triphosphate diphosphatase PhnM